MLFIVQAARRRFDIVTAAIVSRPNLLCPGVAMRLLIDPPADGVTNMARDEALLDEAGRSAAAGMLRFYQWSAPTISLGYFQKYADYEALPPPARGLAVVRRTTGGGAILHDREWTYSLALPVGHPLVGGRPVGLYDLVHDAVIDTLTLLNVPAGRCGASDGSAAHRGPFFCFARRHCADVVVGGEKLAGSAQRRTAAAILQHGSIILANRFDQHPVTSVQAHSGLTGAGFLEPLLEALARRLGEPLFSGAWTSEELAVAERYKNKYDDRAWTRRS